MTSIEAITPAWREPRRTHRWPCVALLAACASCSSGAGVSATFPAAPFSTTMTDSGSLRVELWTSPQPPSRGGIDAQLRITDAKTGAAKDGLTLKILPWMPVMNHGSIAPTITPKGDGKYLVTEVDLFMAGLWEFRTTIGGPVSDHVAPQFNVQ